MRAPATGCRSSIEYDGELAGQLNVSSITYGSLSSATIGYWVAERFAGRNITPTAVALATDHCFFQLGLHRMEICIRPENAPSLRVVEKLGLPLRGAAAPLHPHQRRLARPLLLRRSCPRSCPQGVLRRWLDGQAPQDAATVTAEDRAAAAVPTPYRTRSVTHPRAE